MTTNQVFAWKLPKSVKTTIYEKKKCVEEFEVSRLYSFIKADMGISYLGNRRYDAISKVYPTEQEQMMAYKQRYNKKKELFITGHHLSAHKWGRVIPSQNLSLSIFHRPTRHAFCFENYVDLDMINAQPSCIYEICKHHVITNSDLEKYVLSPKECRQEIMNHHGCNKDTAKNLPITLMFGGTYDGWLKEHGIIKNETSKIQQFVGIESFMGGIMTIVYEANPDILKDVLKQDKNKWSTLPEKKRGVMALWSQTVERMCQEECISYLVEKEIIVLEETIPCQDGFMIKIKDFYPEICADLNSVIKDKYNINIGWSVKEFDERVELPSFGEIRDVPQWNDILSVKLLGDRFIQCFGDYVVRTAQKQVFVYWGKMVDGKVHEGRWYDETTKANRYKLVLYISEQLYSIIKPEITSSIELKKEEIDTLLATLRTKTATTCTIDNIITHILSKIEPSKQEFDSKPFLMGFENGVFDLNLNEFRPYAFDDYLTMTTKYDYIPPDYSIPEDQQLQDTLVKITEDTHADAGLRVLFLQVLASGLDGLLYQRFFLFNGQGGNGKGLFARLMKAILGNYYHTPSNGLLKEVEKANAPSPDIMNLKNKRYINFQEVEGSTINSAVVKKLTGGGSLTGRHLQCNPEEFLLSATVVAEFNQAPDFEGGGIGTRRPLDVFFSTNFLPDEKDPRIDTTVDGIRYKEGNAYYQTEEFFIKMRPVFLDMLLGVYAKYRDKKLFTGIQFDIPESVKERTQKFMDNQNLFLKIFNNHYKRSSDVSKTIKASWVWDSISGDDDHRRVPHSIRKQYGRTEFYTWCKSYLKADDKTNGGVLTIRGIERKDVEETQEEDNSSEVTEVL